MQHLRRLGLGLVAATLVACSSNNGNPAAPGGAAPGTTALGPGGSTLKVGEPTLVSPKDSVVIANRRPVLQLQNTQGTNKETALSYEFQLYKWDTLAVAEIVPQGNGTTSLEMPGDLDYDSLYRWRARARLGEAYGPWAGLVEFSTPPPPPPSAPTSAAPIITGGSGGPVGPNRSISLHEAFNMIVGLHNAWRVNLGSASSRESRIAFLFAAVAVIHYGHPVWNPAGGDPGWCVKDAGGGRPPSDDVLVACGSRDAWDLIGSAGANGYSFHLDYLGRLPGGQNVFPPPASSLPR